MKTLLLWTCFIMELTLSAQYNYQIKFASSNTKGTETEANTIKGFNNDLLHLSHDYFTKKNNLSILKQNGEIIQKFAIESGGNSYVNGSMVKVKDKYFFNEYFNDRMAVVILDDKYQFVKSLSTKYESEVNALFQLHGQSLIESEKDYAIGCHQAGSTLLNLYKIDSDGNALWNKNFSLIASDMTALPITYSDLAVDKSSNIYTFSTIHTNACISKHGSDGQHIMSKWLYDMKAVNIEIAADGTCMLLCSSVTYDQYAIIKLSDKLELVFAKYFTGIGKEINDATNTMTVLDNGDVLLCLPNTFSEGLKLLKLDEKGNLIFAKMILDNQDAGWTNIYDMHDSTFLVTHGLTLIRRMGIDGRVDDCSVLDLCLELVDFATGTAEVKVKEELASPFSQDGGRSLIPVEDSTYFFSNPVSMPTAAFTIEKSKYCQGEFIEIKQKNFYPFGRSVWQIKSKSYSQIETGKNTLVLTMPKDEVAVITHTLNIDDCIYVDSVKVMLDQDSKNFLPNDTTICKFTILNVEVDKKEFSSIVWGDKDINHIKQFKDEGIYYCNAINAAGCNSRDSFKLSLKDLPNPKFDFEYTACEGEVLVIRPEIKEDESIEWMDGNTADTLSVTENTVIFAYMRNVCGLAVFDTKASFYPCDTILFPNVFSPNDDGIEDELTFKAGSWSFVKIEIYDRQNHLMVQGINTNEFSWDGTFNGCPVEIGVYHFIVVMKFPNKNETQTFFGDVTLIR
jgi:gliding motility-associated-like protein